MAKSTMKRFFVQYRAAGNKQEGTDPIAYENINVVGDWVMEKDLCSEISGNPDWTAVDPPLGDVALLGPSVDDIEALGAGTEANQEGCA